MVPPTPTGITILNEASRIPQQDGLNFIARSPTQAMPFFKKKKTAVDAPEPAPAPAYAEAPKVRASAPSPASSELPAGFASFTLCGLSPVVGASVPTPPPPLLRWQAEVVYEAPAPALAPAAVVPAVAEVSAAPSARTVEVHCGALHGAFLAASHWPLWNADSGLLVCDDRSRGTQNTCSAGA